MKLALFAAFVAVSAFGRSPIMPQQTVATVTKIEQFVNLMPVIGPGGRPIRTSLTVEVPSNGCTRATDFVVDVKKNSNEQVVTIVRRNPDTCEATEQRKTIELETEQLSHARRLPVRIGNAFYADVQEAH